MYYIVLWLFQWGFEKHTLLNLISYALYCFVRISVRFEKETFQNLISYVFYFLWGFQWGFEQKTSLKFTFLGFMLFCEDFSDVLKTNRPRIWFLMYRIVLWGFQCGFETELSKIWFLMFNFVLWGFQWGFEKETFQKLISYILYYFEKIYSLEFDFLLFCDDFSEVLKKKFSKIWFLIFNIVLWGFQWGFEKETFQNLITYEIYYFVRT